MKSAGLAVTISAMFLLVSAAITPAPAQRTALEKAKAQGVLHVCVDAYDYPASMQNAEPPGYDVEILRLIAKRAGFGLEFVYPDTGTRGGLGRALRNSIAEQKCSLFTGLGIGPDSDDEMHEKHLVFTNPYMSLGFVLVVQGPAADDTRLDQLKTTRIGVAETTPADAYLFDNHFDRGLYFRDRAILKALDSGEINAALIWSSDLAYIRKDFPDGVKFRPVPGYVPEKDLRWNVAMSVPESETDLQELLNTQIAQLLESGDIKRIVESYGVPFLPPFK